MNYIGHYQSPLGLLTIVSDGNNLIGLFIEGQKYYMNTIVGDLVIRDDDVIIDTGHWLDNYFNGNCPNPHVLPLKPNVSLFRQLVYKILLEIPHGEVWTYKKVTDLLEKVLNRRMSIRAVAGAIAHNPISIIIPCHRVIGSNGKLIGYASGIDKKQKLLELEKNDQLKEKMRNLAK